MRIKIVYPVLFAVMQDKHITMQELANMCNITIQSMYNKMSGKTDWSLKEMRAIKSSTDFKDSLDTLFFKTF